MKYYKFFSHKWLLILIVLLFIVLNCYGAFKNYILFDVNAPDLQDFDAEALRIQVLHSGLSLSSLLFNFSFYQSFIFPIIFIIIGYNYNLVRNNFVKYNIGKNMKYSTEVLKLKLSYAFISVLIFGTVLMIMLLISLSINQFSFDLSYLFLEESILHILITDTLSYVIFYFIVKSLGLFLNTYFIFILIDHFSFLKGSLNYLGFLWVLSPILYRILPTFFVPMTSLMVTSYGMLTVPKIITTYLSYLIVIIYLKFAVKYEVN